MGYYKPHPPDDEVIFTDSEGRDFTWGEHRAMSKTLDEMEFTDPAVRKARQKLDAMLVDSGFDINAPVIPICEFCGREEFRVHTDECPDYINDLPVTRDAGGYSYLDEGFREIWLTSVPANDDEALDYFRILAARWPDTVTIYIKRREMHGTEFKMMPYRYDVASKEVNKIERPGG